MPLAADASATTPSTGRPGSFVTMFTDANTFSAGPQSHLWLADAQLRVSRGADGVIDVSADDGSTSVGLDVAAPTGRPIVRGTTYSTSRGEAFRSAGHASIDADLNGDAFCTGGSFTVHDITPDLSRLWITYVTRCGPSTAGAYGEVRINEPVDPDRLVTASSVTWPAQYRGLYTSAVPVTVINTGSSPLIVRSARVTAGAPAFSISSTTCIAPVRPGANCAVSVRLRPARAGAQVGALTIIDTRGTSVIPLRGGGIPGYTSLALSSQPGDYVGGGILRQFTPADYPWFDVGGADNAGLAGRLGLQILSPPDEPNFWDAAFAAPDGQRLTAGRTYHHGSDGAGNTSPIPLVDVGGDGRGCNSTDDDFTVRQIAYDSDGLLTALSLTFVQRCNGATAALFGSLAWRATQPAAPVPGQNRAPAAVTGVGAVSGYDRAALRWDNPITGPSGATVIRYAPGTVAPSTPTAGLAAYRGTGSGVTVEHLRLGTSYSFALFRTDTTGRASPPATVYLVGSTLTTRDTTARVPAGHRTTLTGQLTDVHTHHGFAGALTIYQRRHGTTTWARLTSVHTTANGVYTLPVRPTSTSQYRAAFAGATAHLGTAGPATTVVVNR